MNLLVVGISLLGVMALAEALRRGGVPAEATRKLVHVGCGVVAGAFPWLFRSTWSVILLAAVFVCLMSVTGRAGGLRSVHGVARRTWGALCFPVAVALTFAVASNRPAAYLPALFVLALSDPAATLVGQAYGLNRYRVGTSSRSLEGSVAFLLCALPCVHVPLLLFSGLPPTAVLAWTALVALLATCVEALSGDGTDNLTVPLVVALSLLRLDGSPGSLAFVASLLAVAAGTLATVARPRASLRFRRVRS